jgi:hypothetical protein
MYSSLATSRLEPLRTSGAILKLLTSQAGCCPVCGTQLVVPPNAPDDLTGIVDRDATTHAARGLVCRRCHAGIAMFGADPSLLSRAADYLAKPMTAPQSEQS